MGKLEIEALHKGKNSAIDIKLSLLSFKEKKIFFIYSPALDLSGYGINEKEAKDSFIKTLDEFFRYTTNKNTLFKELKRLGWDIKEGKKKKMKISSPDFFSLLEKIKSNKDMKQVFNKNNFEKFEETVKIPTVHA